MTSPSEPDQRTPRVDELEYSLSQSEQAMLPRRVMNLARGLERELSAATARIAEMEELHRMQLAAISTASNANTRLSLDRSDIPSANPYWTVAFGDVRIAIEREIEQRERAQKAEQALREQPKINAVALVKMFRDQRDECADALREMINQFAAYSISGDREQALKKARAALIKVPTYEQRLQNVCDGLGITREQLTAALAAPSPDVSER